MVIVKPHPSHLLQIRSQHMEQYVVEKQDRSQNAHNRSLEAAFLAWCEDLKSDEMKFEADKLLMLVTDLFVVPGLLENLVICI